MFIGREREMKTLQTIYDKPGYGMVVIYGRRRIGKSTLISEFVKGKKAVFYTATKVGKERNRELFSEQVVSTLDPKLGDVSFSSTEAVFDFMTGKLGKKKLVLVIDELPYWAQADVSLLSVLQKYIDVNWKDKNIMVILCGSSLSFMEIDVLSEKSPLFGRRDSQIRLDAFDYRSAALFVPNYTDEEKAICFGITGGVAKYLSLIDSGKSLDYNIRKQFFSPDGYLYDETRYLLTQEFSDITTVNNVIEQIASGENTINGIATKTGESEQSVLYAVEKLIKVGLVEKRKCMTDEDNKKKTQYILKDSMFKFWYQFIPKARSAIEMGKGELYYEKIVRPQIHSFMGSVFEEMCRYYVLEQGLSGKFDCFITKVGTWWGAETFKDDDGRATRQSADIDIVAISESDKAAVIGECKFRNEKIDRKVYDTLVRRAGLVSAKYRVTKYLFFSFAGYTEWFETLDNNDVIRLSLEDLYV